MAAIPPPASLDDVVSLIHRLYQPSSPEELSRIQDVLQEVQRSPSGWQLADYLLERQDQHVRFFGALTFTVKLNSDWKSVSEDDVPVLCAKLIGWLVSLLNENSPPLVVKKLCSTLVVFFIRFADAWADCIRHLICCLAVGRAGPVEEFAEMPPSPRLLVSMKPNAKLAALWFTAILVEEVGKVDTKNIKNYHYCLKMQSNEPEAVELIKSAIDMPGSAPESVDPLVVEAGLKTFQAWVSYVARATIEFRLEFPLLRNLTQTAINWLAHESTFEPACDVVIDVLSQSFSFITADDNLRLATILTSEWAVERYELLVTGDTDWGSIQFGRLLITFAEATVQKLAKSLHSPAGRAMFEMLHGMLKIPGYPPIEDEVSGTTFEFWGSLIEYLQDADGEDDSDDPWINDCQMEVKRAVEEFWRKIRIPTHQELAMWGRDQKDGFMSYRKDVADFVEAAYSLLGAGLFRQLVDQVTGALAHGANASWEEIEASLFCLNALSDSVGEEPCEDRYLDQLFGSNLFSLLVDPGVDIPLKARITSVSIVGSYASFFERRPNHLPLALNFLFTCISTPVLARNASRSISSLCSSCRSTLTTELYAFLQQYEIFASSPHADDIAKERVLCAISFVIQALPSEEQKLDPVSKLLGHVEKDASKLLALLQHAQPDEAKEIALLSLRCLVAIGKGLQAPDDMPVDLEASSTASYSSYWQASEGAPLQAKIVELVHMLCRAFQGDGEIVDSACCVFRTGFAETTPGLFVFRPEVITEFLLEYRARTETVLATASTLVSSHSTDGSTEISMQARQFLDFVIDLIVQIGDPQNEPEIAQSIVEFVSRLLRRYVDVLVFYQPNDRLETLFLFALNSLVVRETLVKKAAANFWTQFLGLTDESPEVQAAVDSITAGCSPRLVEKLCWSLGGGCQRSEVDSIAEPLRKLVTRHVRCKSWLTEALKPAGFPTANVNEKDKRLFVEKIMCLRGKRQATNQVAKEFWLKARGTEFAYVS
ncbi:armadillo-type protein [Sphaerosporella brunnea]|uniref:Armadillo-type protein n=1 Tax=Sphaerosporella brunnea TaxID=1250544 RepID=A0A5J5F4G5_9PEZI|nr:armadillo-type protein [Sphaerosporella brunnea]